MVSIYELKLGAEKLEILKALSAEIEKAIDSIGKIDNSHLTTIYNDILEKAKQVLQDKIFVQELKDKVDVAHKDISEKAATINQKFEQQQALLQSLQRLKTEIEDVLKSGLINDTAEKTTTTYSSKKIGELLNLKTDKEDFDDLKNSVNNKLDKTEQAADSTKLGGLAADKYAKKDDIPAAPQAATETKAGIVKLKNSITGNLADTAISENAAKQYADAISNRLLGIDQTLQDVTSQRQIGATYTNKTGRPIQLTIMCLGWADYTIKIGDVSISFGGGDQGKTSKQTYYGIVPNDVEYSLTRGSSFYWWELR